MKSLFFILPLLTFVSSQVICSYGTIKYQENKCVPNPDECDVLSELYENCCESSKNIVIQRYLGCAPGTEYNEMYQGCIASSHGHNKEDCEALKAAFKQGYCCAMRSAPLTPDGYDSSYHSGSGSECNYGTDCMGKECVNGWCGSISAEEIAVVANAEEEIAESAAASAGGTAEEIAVVAAIAESAEEIATVADAVAANTAAADADAVAANTAADADAAAANAFADAVAAAADADAAANAAANIIAADAVAAWEPPNPDAVAAWEPPNPF